MALDTFDDSDSDAACSISSLGGILRAVREFIDLPTFLALKVLERAAHKADGLQERDVRPVKMVQEQCLDGQALNCRECGSDCVCSDRHVPLFFRSATRALALLASLADLSRCAFP